MSDSNPILNVLFAEAYSVKKRQLAITEHCIFTMLEYMYKIQLSTAINFQNCQLPINVIAIRFLENTRTNTLKE